MGEGVWYGYLALLSCLCRGACFLQEDDVLEDDLSTWSHHPGDTGESFSSITCLDGEIG